MRVLRVIPSLSQETGGPAFGVVEVAGELRRRGVLGPILTTDMRDPAHTNSSRRITRWDELPDGADDLDIQIHPVRWPYRLAYSPALANALRAWLPRVDLVHIHMLFLYPTFAAFRAARRLGVPHIVSVHGALDPYLRPRSRWAKAVVDRIWQREMLDTAAALHYATPEERSLCEDLGLKAPAVVIPNGVRWSSFQRGDGDRFRATHLGGTKDPIVLYLGRISHKKGLDRLIAAAGQMTSVLPFTLVIAGPDAENLRPALEEQARTVGIADRTVFTGHVRGETKVDALAAADVWVLPSHSENFGIAALEAMAAGCAVMVSPDVNLAPSIDARGAGLSVRNEPNLLREAIEYLLERPESRNAIGERARAFAREFDWAHIAPQFHALYEGALRQ